jgi:hypothetical protein
MFFSGPRVEGTVDYLSFWRQLEKSTGKWSRRPSGSLKEPAAVAFSNRVRYE